MAKIPAKYVPGKFSLASWPAWVQMIVACFAGALFGGYFASSAALSKQQEMIERRMVAEAMDHFIKLGGEVIRQPGPVSDNGLPQVRRLGFNAINDRFQLQRAIFCGGSLPSVKELDFSPLGMNAVGAGIVDGTALRVAARNFPDVEYLDVSHCSVSDITAIRGMKSLRVLKITNNPLEYAEMQAFKELDSVSELWIGWPDVNLDKDSIYRDVRVRENLLKAISEMQNLKKLYLYDMRLRDAERKLLESFEVINTRMN